MFLATMSDNLHVLYDSHKEDLENLSQIIQVLLHNPKGTDYQIN